MFYDEINFETVNELIEKIELVQDPIEPIKIYFTSLGGGYNVMQSFISYINESDRNFYLVSSGEISSAGFIFFFSTDSYKEILPGTHSVIHIGSRLQESREMLNNNSYDTFATKMMEKDIKSYSKWYKSIGITDKEIKSMEKGNNVLLDTDRLNEILQIIGDTPND